MTTTTTIEQVHAVAEQRTGRAPRPRHDSSVAILLRALRRERESDTGRTAA